jgi:hypothetical protein
MAIADHVELLDKQVREAEIKSGYQYAEEWHPWGLFPPYKAVPHLSVDWGSLLGATFSLQCQHGFADR